MKYDSVWPASMPYDTLKVVDNSIYNDTASDIIEGTPTGPIAYIPFVSDRGYGEDKKLVYINSARIGKYGKPNLNKLGLSLYLANQFILGGGTVLGMRVVPNFTVTNKYVTCESTVTGALHVIATYVTSTQGATGALQVVADSATPTETQIRISDVLDVENVQVGDYVKKNTPGTNEILRQTVLTDVPTVTVGDYVKLTVDSYYGPSYANKFVCAKVHATNKTIEYVVGNVSALAANGNDPADYFNASTTTAADLGITLATGETLYKLFIVKTKSAGAFGKNFNIGFTVDTTMNSYASARSWKAFFYKFYDDESGENLDSDMTFTFADGITYDSNSMDPEDVFDTYSENVAFTKGAGLNAFFGIDATNINPAVNFLFPEEDTEGAKKLGEWTVTNTAIDVDSMALAGTCELFVSNSFTWDNDPFATIIAGAYGYERTTAPAITRVTDLIYDEIRYPFQYIFAPSYNTDVIAAVRDLLTKRDITHVVYTSPKYDTFSELRGALEAETSIFKAVTDWREHMIPEWAYYKDPYMAKKTLLPVIYELARLMPNHWINRKGRPYAGVNNFALTEYVTGTVVPHTALNAEFIKNHNDRFNTLVEDGFGHAVPYEQITAYNATSSLSECNNSFILTDMIRIAKKVANDKRWTDLSADAINDYKTTVQNAIAGELGNCYDTMEVVTSRESVNGAGRNRIKCAITVYFKDIFKGVSYVFYIAAANS